MRVVFEQLLTPEPERGVIIIRSNVAGDSVWIDGRRLGSTPQRLEIRPGKYVVRVEKAGYQPVERRVEVSAGQEATIRTELFQPTPTVGPARAFEAPEQEPNLPSTKTQMEWPSPTPDPISPPADSKTDVTLDKADVGDAVPVRFVPGGAITPPVFVRGPRPKYSEDARLAGVKGVVVLECVISKDGRVISQKVLQGLPSGLTEAATSAVLLWEFEPATKDGMPVDVVYFLSVRFNLE
jgi:TonB family protein